MTIRSILINSLVSVCLSASLFAAGCSSESATDTDVAVAAEAQEAEVRGAKARLGQACNDFTGNRCVKGLACKMTPLPVGKVGIPERGGICTKPSPGVGDACNEFTGNPCATGFACDVAPLPPGVVGIPERGGICRKPRVQNECATDDDCAPSDRCAPGKCYAFCLDDTSCCAPSTCQPAPAPAPTATACGEWTCGEGLVCCNSLRGICTKPGEFCIY